jgi:phytoene desaturase
MSKIIVIGSGFGGLSAATRLAVRGHQVQLFEKRDKLGGRAYVYEINGFKFDGGPTVITAPWLFDEIWELAGRNREDYFKIVPLDPFYRIFDHTGQYLDYNADHDFTLSQIDKFNPADKEGYTRFIATTKEIFETGMALIDKPFLHATDMVKVIPDLVRLQSYRSVYGYVSKYVKNDFLRRCFSFHPLLIGGNPLSTTAYYCLIAHLERMHGVHYAMGGMGALVNGIAGLVGDLGGRIRCNAEVAEILVENGRAAGVRLADGEQIVADIVVSNADAGWTYSKLLARHPRRRWTDRKVARARYSMSLFVWYFGTSRKFDDVYHHTMVLGPRYEGLLHDIFRRKHLSDDFSLYLHRPTMTDPSLAPPGCDAFYVLSPVPHLGSGVEWSTRAEPYRAAIQKRLEETVMPGLGEALVTSRIITPQDFRDRLLSVNGAAFSLEPQLFQSAWFRPHNRSEEVEGLYLVGAGTHPGAGVPGVISSARILDQLVPEGALYRR